MTGPAHLPLPVVSYKLVDPTVLVPPDVLNPLAVPFGYNDGKDWSGAAPEAQDPDARYTRWLQPMEAELAKQVEYDMDEQDQIWLDAVNAERESKGNTAVSYEVFEIIFDKIEKEWFDLTKSIPKKASALPDDNSKCAICDDGECENSNAIVFCDGCNLAVHQDCYGVPYIPEGQWLCRKCTVSPHKPVSCVLCPNSYGAFKQTTTARWAHLLCAIWIPDTGVSNTVYMEPIDGVENISKSRWKLICYLCRKRVGACIQCANRNCFAAFHVTCAREAGLELKMKQQGDRGGELRAYCEKHSDGYTPSGSRAGSPAPGSAAPQKRSHKRKVPGLYLPPGVNTPSVLSSSSLKITLSIPQKTSSKSARAYKKSYNSGPPVIPAFVFDRVMQYTAKIRVMEKKEFMNAVCRYWSLKREARRGAPLLKRLHLEPWTASATSVQQSDADKGKNLELMRLVRNDLEKVRMLTERVRKREKKKLERVQLLKDFLDDFVFTKDKILRNVLERISLIDKQKFFAQPVSRLEAPDYYDIIKHPMDWSTMLEKIDQHEYLTAEDFQDDFALVINNARLYNKPQAPVHRAAVRLQEQSESILAEIESLDAPSSDPNVLKHQLGELLSDEVMEGLFEFGWGPLPKELEEKVVAVGSKGKGKGKATTSSATVVSAGKGKASTSGPKASSRSRSTSKGGSGESTPAESVAGDNGGLDDPDAIVVAAALDDIDEEEPSRPVAGPSTASKKRSHAKSTPATASTSHKKKVPAAVSTTSHKKKVPAASTSTPTATPSASTPRVRGPLGAKELMLLGHNPLLLPAPESAGGRSGRGGARDAARAREEEEEKKKAGKEQSEMEVYGDVAKELEVAEVDSKKMFERFETGWVLPEGSRRRRRSTNDDTMFVTTPARRSATPSGSRRPSAPTAPLPPPPNPTVPLTKDAAPAVEPPADSAVAPTPAPKSSKASKSKKATTGVATTPLPAVTPAPKSTKAKPTKASEAKDPKSSKPEATPKSHKAKGKEKAVKDVAKTDDKPVQKVDDKDKPPPKKRVKKDPAVALDKEKAPSAATASTSKSKTPATNKSRKGKEKAVESPAVAVPAPEADADAMEVDDPVPTASTSALASKPTDDPLAPPAPTDSAAQLAAEDRKPSVSPSKKRVRGLDPEGQKTDTQLLKEYEIRLSELDHLVAIDGKTELLDGTLVWAKAPGYNFFPAEVADPAVEGMPDALRKGMPDDAKRRKLVAVLFWDENRSGQWLERTELKLFSESKEYDELLRSPIAFRKRHKKNASKSKTIASQVRDLEEAYEWAASQIQADDERLAEEEEETQKVGSKKAKSKGKKSSRTTTTAASASTSKAKKPAAKVSTADKGKGKK